MPDGKPMDAAAVLAAAERILAEQERNISTIGQPLTLWDVLLGLGEASGMTPRLVEGPPGRFTFSWEPID